MFDKPRLQRIWNYGLGQVFTLFAIAIIIGPAIAGYILKWNLQASVALIGISVYAIHSIIHFVFQVVSAEINNYRMRKQSKECVENWADIKVAIIVAGYREDPYMFERCVKSIKDSKYSNIARVICIVDGNENDDKYMAEIFDKVYGTEHMKLDFLLSECDNTQQIDYSQFQTSINQNVCIMQPHKGKRDAMYTGMKMIMTDPSVQAVITTDSDTILDENVIKELVYPLRFEHIGAVAGQVLIWNTDSLLTFIISFRYWMSFNLERACESLWQTVLCIAGPMGCYKMDLVKDVLEEWVHQKFLGNRCTYGDDRHLTNRILMKGKKVVYTPTAVGYTDTPYSFERYLVQQTRWSKSFFREFFFTIGCIHKHFIWMGYELVYHFAYFFLLIYWVIHLLYFANVKTQIIAVFVTTTMSIIRAGYGAIRAKDWKFLLFNLYSYVYYFVIIPAKMMALLTMWDISWGTRGGDTKSSMLTILGSKFKTYFTLIAWTCASAGGFAYSLYLSHDFVLDDYTYRVGFIGAMVYIGYILANVICYYTLHFTGISHTPLLNQIKQDKENIAKQNAGIVSVTVETSVDAVTLDVPIIDQGTLEGATLGDMIIEKDTPQN